MGIVLHFLEQRKEKWLKKEIKKEMSEAAVRVLTVQAEDKFALRKWILEAAEQAKQVALNKNAGIATHVGKFTHPDAKASPIISYDHIQSDGYLHSGNIKSEWDILGNASAAPIFDFLLTTMSDGETIAEHLARDSQEIREELIDVQDAYETIRSGFLSLKKDEADRQSDERVKQVYFPVGDASYHLLSLLPASGLLRELKTRLDGLQSKRRAAKDSKNEQYGIGYDAIYNLTEIAFGGSKPQNISVINSKNRGKAYLLPSMPPAMTAREIRRPRYDFFQNTLWIPTYRSQFYRMHALLKCERNNLAIRHSIEIAISEIIDTVMLWVYGLRAMEHNWSSAETYRNLPMAQKIWLDDAYVGQREAEETWMQEIEVAFARWLMYAYKKIVQENYVSLGDGEMVFLQNQVHAVLQQDKGRVG